MISPTLFELAAITGLRPIGKTIHFNLTLDYVKAYNFNDFEPSYSAFIRNNIGPPSTPVSDVEHVAFHIGLMRSFSVVEVCKCNVATSF